PAPRRPASRALRRQRGDDRLGRARAPAARPRRRHHGPRPRPLAPRYEPGRGGGESLMPTGPIGIAGAGAWGTALANAAASAGSNVTLWMRNPGQVAELAASRANERFLPGITLHDRIRP